MRPLQEAQLRDAKSHEQGLGSRAIRKKRTAKRVHEMMKTLQPR